MAYDIGPKIGIDGESEFRKSIKQVSETIKTLGSEMKVVTSAFADNADSMEALAAKNEVLRKQADAVYEKMKLQAQMAGSAAGKYGEASAEAQKWQRALNESTAEFNKLKTEIKANERAMDDLGKETDQVEEHLDDAGKAGLSFGDVLKANVLSDAITSGIRALGSAVADMAREFLDFAKAGVETASDLEEVQNVVDTTFGTKVPPTLVRGIGDFQAAAIGAIEPLKSGAEIIEEFANSAANNFGLSALSAKQFTGTMGAMLKSMGLTEDAVLEMSTDIAGLAGDMASFYNLDPEEAFAKLRSGISGETEPLKQLGINMSVANLEAYALAQGITKAYKDMTQAEQATLRYNYLMQATADAQGDFARTSDSYANQQRILQLNMENLGASIGTKVLPYLTGFSTELNGLLSGQTNIQTFVSNLSGMVLQAANGILAGLPALAEVGSQIFSSLFAGLETLGPTVTEVALQILDVLINGILTGLPMLLETGASLLVSLVTGISERLPDLIPAAAAAVTELAIALTSPDSMMQLLDAAGQMILGLVEGIFAAIPNLISSVPVIIENFVSTITNPKNQKANEDAGKKMLGSLITGLLNTVSSLVKAAGDIVIMLLQQFSYAAGDMLGIGKDVIDGFWRGIKEKWEQVKAWLSNAVNSLVSGVKKLLGINSPSRVFAGIGGYMAEGVGVGFDREIGAVQKDINKSMAGLIPEAQSSVSVTAQGGIPVPGAIGYSAADLRQALAGVGIYMSGQRVGELTTVAQRNNARALGTA